MAMYDLQRYEFAKNISEQFPYTMFHWWYEKDEKIFPTRHKTFQDIPYKFNFLKKDKMLRTTLWDDKTDELRLDFDNDKIEDNLIDVRKVILRLLDLNIENFETYLSGGKGLHLQLRYDYKPFIEYSREVVRKLLFEYLDIDVKVDESLFRTTQMLGMEGYNHRKTNNPKKRIKIDYDSYKELEPNINLDYLSKDYVNTLPSIVVSHILSKVEDTPSKNINPHTFHKKKNYDSKKFQDYISRFKELYPHIKDGKKRFLDCFTRYLWLTTHNEEVTKYHLRDFIEEFNITYISVDDRFKSTIKSMKSNAIFLYKDVLTKEDFYEGFNCEVLK